MLPVIPGMFSAKLPSKEAALKKLKKMKSHVTHVAMFGAFVVAVRVASYVLQYLSAEDVDADIDIEDS